MAEERASGRRWIDCGKRLPAAAGMYRVIRRGMSMTHFEDIVRYDPGRTDGRGPWLAARGQTIRTVEWWWDDDLED